MPTAQPSTAPAAVRLVELDGLRGLAAGVVLLHHMLLLLPTLAEVGAHPGVVPSGTLEQILVRTPLHLLWAGHEAVLIFYVLSGVALVFPVARRHAQGRRFDWVDYAPRRVIRLWVPAAASTLLTVGTILLVPRSTDPALGAWITQGHPPGLSAVALARQLLLLPKHAYHNTVLWSLHAEAVFSILLPLVVLVVALAARWRAWWLPTIAALAVPAITGSLTTGTYLPVFLIGASLGWHWGHAPSLLPPAPARWANAAAAACLITMTAAWWPGMEGQAAQRLAACLTLASATALVILVVRAGAMRGLLRNRVVQYLGAMSFSLYLVHEPVVVTLRLATASLSPWWALVAAPLVAAPLTWAFQRWIEAPSHRLSRRAGRWASSRVHARLQARTHAHSPDSRA